MDDDVEIETGSLNIFAEPVPAVGFIDGALEAFSRTEIFAANVDIRLMTADGISRNDHSFEKSVRVPFQDVAILESSRFALICVDDEVFWFWALFGNESPLPGRWESSAA